MGRWSAAHRKTAIFGWLAFVVVAVALGSVVGTKSLESADAEAGDARRALQIVDAAFDDTVDESVFIEHGSLPLRAPSSRRSSTTSSRSSTPRTAFPRQLAVRHHEARLP